MKWIDLIVVCFLVVSCTVIVCDVYDLVSSSLWTISYGLILYYCPASYYSPAYYCFLL
jgi:hypothetical protein